jgi:hypothetical protein
MNAAVYLRISQDRTGLQPASNASKKTAPPTPRQSGSPIRK